ncbi:MAG TPA: hypothetical protein VGI40_28560 [Pirellulaceae bacterium]|jgi:hypothetical protein
MNKCSKATVIFAHALFLNLADHITQPKLPNQPLAGAAKIAYDIIRVTSITSR